MVLTKHVAAALLAASVVMFTGISAAHAATPTVSASYTGSGDTVQLTITGDANAPVILNYLGAGSAVQMTSLGKTGSGGTFSQAISTAAYGIAPGSLINVSVNNFRSDSIVWPYGTTGSTGSGTITLSQSALTLSIGQSSVISVNNTTGNSLYLANNTTPAVANISISNNQVTVAGVTAGSTSFQVCSAINASNCATAVVTVTGSNSQTIGFSQNNITVGSGQTVPVTVTGGTGTYVISSNSNPNAIQATVNGSIINVYALSSSGSATITVCSSTMSSCGIITVAAGTSSSVSGSVTFSQASPALTPGQVLAVTLGGGSGSYYISSNSNSSVVQANIVGNTLTLYGNSNGSSFLSVCASSGGCGNLSVTVAAPGTLALTLSQSALTLGIGQSASVALSGAGGYAVSSNSNSSVASASVNGSTLMVAGSALGTTMVTVCQSGGGCALLTVTVNSSSVTTPVSSLALTHMLNVGQDLSLQISGGSGSYTLSSNPGTPFSANISSANVLTLHGTAIGTASVNLCATNGGCIAIAATVAAAPLAVTPVVTVPIASPVATTPAKYKFTSSIVPGDRTADVTELQKRLKTEGVFTGEPTGFFGAATLEAVKKYQTRRGLNPIGTVGPATRAALNGE